MTKDLFETLLNENESSSLDFKGEQYLFERASDEAKGELLKDLLAFANSWRRTDAYILLGVEEVQSGRAKIVGVTEHLRDNDLQQFINSKTNRRLDFSYTAFPFEGKEIGVIHIPRQERPFFLAKNFGRLKKELVYYRVGSSTGIANSEEIAGMGVSNLEEELVPALNLQWADVEKRKLLGNKLQLEPIVFNLPDDKEIPLAGNSFDVRMNRFYYKQFRDYIHALGLG